MKLSPNSFFPDLKFEEINLNKFFKSLDIYGNKPYEINNALLSLHAKKKLNTFGGYGEDRSYMWLNTYIDESQKYYHLGIDINVPHRTLIQCPFRCRLVQIFIDDDTDIGWGVRTIFATPNNSDYYLVLGHLSQIKFPCINNFYGSQLGFVGTYPYNGNVFEHLHIQAIKKENINNFDGYGFKEDLKDNPNPFEIEW